jgi:hypothetical protein
MSYNLFLDDIRVPVDVGNYINPVELRSLFRLKEWVIVRNYNQFVDYIERNGVPALVSFDHDLADEHYVPERYWDNYEESKKYQSAKSYTEKTGYDCAQWLLKYCKEKHLQLPNILCHSMNPIGKEKILRLVLNEC